MTSVFETLMEQTVGVCINVCTEAMETVICNTLLVPIWQPIVDAFCSTLFTGK